MELELLTEKSNELEFVIKGERHTLPNLLRNELLNDSSVVFVAYSLRHPFDKDCSFIVRTKGKNARKALEAALRAIDKQLNEFSKQVGKAL